MIGGQFVKGSIPWNKGMITPQKRAKIEIRKIRHEMRLSQRAFAELMGVDRQTILHWEKGSKNPIHGKGVLLYIWWRGPIKAARIAGRIIQAAFS